MIVINPVQYLCLRLLRIEVYWNSGSRWKYYLQGCFI